jgi:U4/U6 small nuclear ribonucleoprotein PRP4
MSGRGELFDRYLAQKQSHDVAVPTTDLDVKRTLRSLKQPICLFGEDPKDRRDRLRKVLVKTGGAVSSETDGISENLPRIEVGSVKVSQAKRFFIDYSLPRSQQRLQSERRIDEDRISEINLKGSVFKDYQLYASEFVDKRPLTCLSVSRSTFAVGSLSGSVSIYSGQTMERSARLTLHDTRVTSVCFIDDFVLSSTSADMSLIVWRSDSSDRARLDFDAIPQKVVKHPSGRFLVSGLSDGTLAVIDLDPCEVLARMKSNDGVVTAVSCHSNGNLVFSGGDDTVGRIWDLRSMTPVKVCQGHSDRLTCCAFDDGFHIISGSADNTMICWDLRNLTRSVRIAGHTNAVTSVAVRGDLLLSSSMDASLKIWSLLDFRTYATVTKCVSSVIGASFLEWNDAGRPMIVTASRDGSWRFYHCDSDF